MSEAEARPPTQDALSALLAEIVAATDAAGPAPWERVLAPGSRIGRFELVRELGRGGFGVVFEALDGDLRRRVAFKAIRPGARGRDPGSAELLRREAMAVAQLQHPNIVTLFDAGADAGPYLIFELLRGETLARRLERGRVSAREAMRIALAVSRALVHAHANGVLHRDLKPSNVFLCADGGVKVLDFGLAHVFGAGGPVGSGTPGYMAPEQRRGAPEDARTDVYAVGVLLAEMVTGGRTLGPGADVAALLAEARIPAPLGGLAARCTAPDPAGRPPDAAALARALERLIDALDRSPRRPAAAASGPAAVEALRHFFRGEECQARPVFGQDCAEHYRRAVELDPTLAAAHYQLAVWTRRFGGPVAEQRAAIARALAHCDGAPPLEQVLIRAFAAHLDGRDADAMSLFREAIERWPDDKRAFYELGDLLRHQDELELAVPYFERAIAIDPDLGWALAQLAEALGARGRSGGSASAPRSRCTRSRSRGGGSATPRAPRTPPGRRSRSAPASSRSRTCSARSPNSGATARSRRAWRRSARLAAPCDGSGSTASPRSRRTGAGGAPASRTSTRSSARCRRSRATRSTTRSARTTCSATATRRRSAP